MWSCGEEVLHVTWDDFKKKPTGIRLRKMKEAVCRTGTIDVYQYLREDKDGNMVFNYNECLWLSENLKIPEVPGEWVVYQIEKLSRYIQHVRDNVYERFDGCYSCINHRKIIESGKRSAIIVKCKDFHGGCKC